MNKTLLIKGGVIFVIAVILLIILASVSGTISERQNYKSSAKDSVARGWTGEQNVFGPILAVPYNLKWSTQEWSGDGKRKIVRQHSRNGTQYVLPETTQLQAQIATDIRYQGIYKLPVYSSELNFSGSFSSANIAEKIKLSLPQENAQLKLSRPYLSLAVSDARGINSVPILNWGGNKHEFKAGSQLSFMDKGIHAPLPSDVLNPIKDSQDFPFSLKLSLRGMDSIKFFPSALDFQLMIESPWPHPKFYGDFLPLSRSVSDQGFNAQWQVSAFASNIEKKIFACENNSCKSLKKGGFGVEFIEAVDVYLQSERSLKYGFLFIGLVFVAFFVFEILKKLPIHPVQYGLVGLAIALFYLLLMSLSEHINFMLSYIIAALACASLISFYLVYVLRHAKTAGLFAALLVLLYFTLYIIVSAEDLALLMGSVLVFIVLAVVMIATRNINWYEVGDGLKVEIKGEE
jgi:inner membrane protein